MAMTAHRWRWATSLAWLLLASSAMSGAEAVPADHRGALNAPLLFVKRFNYQGLHIYDTFYQWRPGGGIYILDHPADPPGAHRVHALIDATTPTTLGNGIYFDPALSYDAKRVLFCYKGSATGNSVIYEIGVDGSGLRQITNLDANGNPYTGHGSGHHDVKPGYCADGRIVFTSTRYSGLVPCANNGVAILHIMNADGTDIHTISVNNVTEFDPCLLPDGRILFGRWEYVDRNALVIQSLWTILPDGRNETALYANNMVFPEAVLQAKPVPGNDELVVATFTPHNAPPRGTIAMIDLRLGKNDPAAIFNFESPGHPTADHGESCDPWALDEQTVLYSGVPPEADAPSIPRTTPGYRDRSNPRLNALMLIDRSGKRVVVHGDTAIDLHNPIPLLPRPVPRASIDATDRSQTTGSFFVHDVYASMPQVKRGSVKWLRVVEETSRVSASPGGTWMNQTFSISAALAWSAKIYHGIVPVDADGSVYFEAPSGRALYFQLLDGDYRLVRGMRTFIQAVPGTVRSCVGCHDYGPKTSGVPRLVNRAPLQLRPESWGSGYLDYTARVQPILDAKCVSCHGGEKGMAAGLDLSRGWTEFFNISYEHLTARRERMYTADLIAGICGMNGTAHWSCKVFAPYEHGSGKAPLADRLLAEPHRDYLSQQERETIFAWMDSNGMYFGTWDYTAAGPRSQPFLAAVERITAAMKEAGCGRCHATERGEIRRFDQWINLDRPEMSRVLRAPLPIAMTAAGGYGLGLCRERTVDQSFSRKGLIYGFGYAHGVLPLDKFPTQSWPSLWPPAGAPVTSFASTADPAYRTMLRIIREERAAQLARPRVDMPTAELVGDGIHAGRARQIIPQALPEPLPEVQAALDDDGGVRLTWESSARTIGLVAEIHRHTVAGFTPDVQTRIARTERCTYRDPTPPAGTAHYAVVLVSDPAETCGTCKSGAVLDYLHDGGRKGVEAMQGRCPLSTFVARRSPPLRATLVVPELLPALQVAAPDAVARPGYVLLRWDAVGSPGATSYDVWERCGDPASAPRILNAAPLRSPMFMAADAHGGHEVSYAVVANAPRRTASTMPREECWVPARPLPLRAGPVWQLAADAPGLTVHQRARWEGDTLQVSEGGYAQVTLPADLPLDGPFSVVCDVCFDEPGDMPVVLGCGRYNGPGWFLQKIGGRWRFHLGGVSCDGGQVPVGSWLRMVGVYDGTMARLYQDGRQVAQAAVPTAVVPAHHDLYLGRYSAQQEPPYRFTGKIRGLALFQRVVDGEGK